MQIAKDTVVSLEYTLRDEAGNVLDESAGHGPLSYVHGRNEIVPGLERELLGKQPGDELSVSVSAEDGYGVYDDGLIIEVPRTQLPAEIALESGLRLIMSDEDGDEMPVMIVEVKADSVVMDGNHPLAGRALRFDVEVKEVRALGAEDGLADCCRAGTCGS